jgi:hypothetical protein
MRLWLTVLLCKHVKSEIKIAKDEVAMLKATLAKNHCPCPERL